MARHLEEIALHALPPFSDEGETDSNSDDGDDPSGLGGSSAPPVAGPIATESHSDLSDREDPPLGSPVQDSRSPSSTCFKAR